jgi:hypothetical protein
MIRALRALVWLRWRLVLGAIRGGQRRDMFEQIARALALVLPLVFIALSIGSALVLGALGVIAGRALAGGTQAVLIVTTLRLALLALLTLTVVVSLASPAQTTVTLYNRLLVLPVPRGALHVVEAAASLVDPWIGPMVIALLFFAAGLASGGAAAVAAVALVAALAVMTVLASLAALVRSLVAWLLRSRRRGEVFTLVLVIGLSLVSFIPPLVSRNIEARQREARQTGAPQPDVSLDQVGASLPRWTHALPSELYGLGVRAAAAGRMASAWAHVGGLALEGVLLFALSAAVHRRLLESIESDHRHRATAAVHARVMRLPLLNTATSAVALAQVRTSLRSVRGRLAVLLPGPIVALMVMLLRGMPEVQLTGLFTTHSYVLLGGGIIFSLYALQPFTMNLFGSDRAGLTLEFLAPMSGADLARGKVAGCAMVFAVSAAICVVSTLAVSRAGSPLDWLATLAGGAATYMLFAPIAVWLSALFPVASDLSKTGAGGNPHPLSMLVGTFVVILLAAPAALILAGVSYWGQRHAMALAAMLMWMVTTALAAWPLMRLASRAVDARRENLALVAQGR